MESSLILLNLSLLETFAKHLICAKHCSKYFIKLTHLILTTINFKNQVLLLASFYRWGKCSRERLSYLFKVLQLIKGRVKHVGSNSALNCSTEAGCPSPHGKQLSVSCKQTHHKPDLPVHYTLQVSLKPQPTTWASCPSAGFSHKKLTTCSSVLILLSQSWSSCSDAYVSSFLVLLNISLLIKLSCFWTMLGR